MMGESGIDFALEWLEVPDRCVRSKNPQRNFCQRDIAPGLRDRHQQQKLQNGSRNTPQPLSEHRPLLAPRESRSLQQLQRLDHPVAQSRACSVTGNQRWSW
ncbi:hypothetical protein BQ8482_360121 [Mesorhizobium delmotii]|uniref:Uncharacterized protein n=1 Tax=Mesorhizobium delmotii TaxID=1631247 RepID=A0A2P9ARC4_9HYPH|nr:hypothetical protein BQ8482_360121 [Mesorhizobium delmotii]